MRPHALGPVVALLALLPSALAVPTGGSFESDGETWRTESRGLATEGSRDEEWMWRFPLICGINEGVEARVELRVDAGLPDTVLRLEVFDLDEGGFVALEATPGNPATWEGRSLSCDTFAVEGVRVTGAATYTVVQVERWL